MMGKDLSGNGRETAEHSEEKAGESADQVSAAWRDVPMSLAGLTSTTPAEHHSGKPQHQLDVVCPTWYAGHMIPDIVIDPIPPRDSFGHSHTPPLVQRQWGLGSPPAAGAGKKVRAHSDSSIVELEKSQRRLSSDTQQQHIPQALHPGTQEGRAAQLDAERHLERAARAPPTSGEVEGRPLPMEVDNSGMVRSGSDNTGLGGSSAGAGTREMGQSGYAPSGQASPQTSLVPSSPSSLSSFQAPEKSPKMYWLRRHSDSHMPPGSASSSSLAEEQLAVTSTVQTSRSQSTGDMELDPGSPAPSTPGHAMFTERIKLKKYLQRRYQSSLDKESGPTEAGLATAKTESTQPENQPPATRPSSPPTARQPAGDRSISPQPSSSQTSDRRTGAGDGGSGMAPPSRKPPRLSLQETMPLKLEPVSPVSGSDTEAETPVFFSPSFVSPRVFSDNSRWCHNVFQFPVTRMHQVGPQTGETEVKGVAVAPKEGWAQEESRGESSRAKGEEAGGKSPDGSRLRSASPVELSVYATAAAASPPEMQHSRCLSPIVYRMSGIQHRAHPAMGRSRSEGHMPSRPLSPVLQARCQASSPTAQSAQISPLPPFPSIIRQHTAMSHSQLSAPGSHPTPFSTYPASTSALSPRPVFQWSAPAPRASPEAEAGAAQLPSQFQSLTAPPAGTSTTSTSTSTRRTDPSKMIYCPFGDEVREQRLRQDGTAVFRCPVCSQLFPSYYYLANHMVNHLPSEVVCKGPGDANKVHLCKVCNRAFSRSDMLTRHMRLHTGLKPYECRTCGQVFSRSDHLHTHQRTHTGEKPYKCPRCPYAAPRRDMITRHMRIHTKHFTRRSGARHRAASTSSDVTSPPAETTSEVRRRNQSLSSIDSLESDQSASFRQSSTASTDADVLLEEEDADRRRHWSVTSADSVESTPDVGMVTSTSGSRHWSAESAESYAAPSPGSLLEEEEEGSTAVYRRLPAAADSLSTDVQMSFQRCAVTSDKDNTSSSEKSSPASIAMEDTAKTGAENK